MPLLYQGETVEMAKAAAYPSLYMKFGNTFARLGILSFGSGAIRPSALAIGTPTSSIIMTE